jgi:hypothetical protein
MTKCLFENRRYRNVLDSNGGRLRTKEIPEVEVGHRNRVIPRSRDFGTALGFFSSSIVLGVASSLGSAQNHEAWPVIPALIGIALSGVMIVRVYHWFKESSPLPDDWFRRRGLWQCMVCQVPTWVSVAGCALALHTHHT